MASPASAPSLRQGLISERDALDHAIDGLTGVAQASSPHDGMPFSRILLVYDGALPSDHAAAWGSILAKARRARITILTPRPPQGLTEKQDRARRRGLDALEARLEREKLPHDTIEASGDPASEILRAAQLAHADLVMMGANVHSNIRRLSDQARRVLGSTRASTFIARGAPPPHRILAPTDGSAASRDAARIGVHLARDLRVPLDLFHVARADPSPPVGESILHGVLDETPVHAILASGDPAGAIIARAAATKSNLIVLGCRGLGDPLRRDPGSVSMKVAADARANVLVMRSEKA